MIKKSFIAVAAVCAMCIFAMPAQAQFGKKLGKSLGKVAKSDVGKAVTGAVGDMAGDMAANQVAAKMTQFMDNNNTVSDPTSAYSKRLESLVASKYTSVDGLTLAYKVYENPEVNILALADGNIRVYSGMMDFLTDDELTAVIANQIGHIANKDVRDALIQVGSKDNAGKAAGSQMEKMLSFSGDKLGSVINELIQVPYTEDQNKAADEYAATLLKTNGKNANALASALNKFAELEASDAAIQAATEEGEEVDGEISPASKYIGVNSGNSVRASFLGF